MSKTINHRLAQLETIERARLWAEMMAVLDECSNDELRAMAGVDELTEEQVAEQIAAAKDSPPPDLAAQYLTVAQLQVDLARLKDWRTEYRAREQANAAATD